MFDTPPSYWHLFRVTKSNRSYTTYLNDGFGWAGYPCSNAVGRCPTSPLLCQIPYWCVAIFGPCLIEVWLWNIWRICDLQSHPSVGTMDKYCKLYMPICPSCAPCCLRAAKAQIDGSAWWTTSIQPLTTPWRSAAWRSHMQQLLHVAALGWTT